MVLRKFLFCALCIAIILCGNSALAQKQFGSIQGTVLDADRQPIPGATVVASTQSRGSTIVHTDTHGRYRMESLIPDTYDVQAELAGFQSVLQSGIRISAGSTGTVDFILEPEGIAESITVQGGTFLIDSTTTAISHTVQPEIIQGLPERHFREILSLTPGVGDDLTAYGASITSNRMWIDGIDISSGSNGGIFVDYNYNWMEEVQVIGNGAPAEYSNYLGVIGNYVTRSGSNQYHGLLETFFFNEDLVSTNDPDADPEQQFKSWDISTQVGGPLIRDKLWFFAGLQYPYMQSTPFRYDGVLTEEYPKLIGKLTYKPDQNNTIQGFGHYNQHQIDGAGAGIDPLGFFAIQEATMVTNCNEGSWNATWISLLSSATTIEGRFGGIWGNCNFLPRNGDTPAHFHMDTRINSGNAKLTQRHSRLQPQGNFEISHHAQDYLGIHDFKFGVQYNYKHIEQEHTLNGGFVYYDYSDISRNFRVAYGPFDYNGDISQFSVFAQDSWSLNDQLTLSLGLRWERNRGSTDRGVVFSTDPLAPRIGAVWTIGENQPVVLKAHYGDYYDALLSHHFVKLSDQPFGRQRDVFINGTWQMASREREVYFGAPDIRHPFVRQFTVGADKELFAGVAGGAHYIHRIWHNIIEDVDINSVYKPVPFVNPVTGEILTVYSRLPAEERHTLSTNAQGLYRKYDAVEVYANRRFLNRLAVSASFVYSKSRGNIPNTREIFSSGFDPILNDPNTLINFDGRLVNDPTFQWKISGTYNFPYGMNLGWFFRHTTGDTWAPLLRLPRNIVSQGGQILALPRGTNRLPSQNILDLRVEKQFALRSGQFRVTADIFNVFNAAYATAVGAIWGTTTYGQPTLLVEPREIRLGLRYTF